LGGRAINANADAAAHLEDELDSLLELMPARLAAAVADAQQSIGALQDIRLDVGRVPEVVVDEKSYELTTAPVSREEIAAIDAAISQHGGRYNDQLRASLDDSIHRISPVKNGDRITGFSMRPARIAVVDDFSLAQFVLPEPDGPRKSLLIIGPPGSGKSTKLRSVIRELSEEYGLGMSVVVVDDAGELGGSGDRAHPGLGRARRLPHVTGESQAFLMKQAVRNHGARVLAVDELAADKQEVMEAIWATHSGITLVATTHAKSLEDLVENRTIDLLIGGVKEAAVKDGNMARNGGNKFAREAGTPAFDVAVELHDDKYVIHTNVKNSVAAILAGRGLKGLVQEVPRQRMRVTPQSKRPVVLEGGDAGREVA
jgi:stage III sporulation protein SpoIIIAA